MADRVRYATFGRLLRDGRKAKGWTLDQLLKAVEDSPIGGTDGMYSRSTASRWENGTRVPPPPVVECLADVLVIDEALLLKAAGYDPSSTQLIDQGALVQELKELARDVVASIGVARIEVVPKTSLKLMGMENQTVTESSDSGEALPREFPGVDAEKRALYDRFVRLTTSQQYRRSVRAWQENVAEYEALAKAGDAQTGESYARASRAADQAVTELWNAVEAIRWGQ